MGLRAGVRRTKVRLSDLVTGGEHVAPGGFDIYRPAVPGPALMGPVAPGHIVLLTPQHVLASRISTEALGAILKEVEKEIVEEGGATPIEGGADLVVDFVGDGGQNTFRLGFRPEMPRPFADRVQARLDKLPVAPVGHGEIHVQLYYRLNGGASDSLAH